MRAQPKFLLPLVILLSAAAAAQDAGVAVTEIDAATLNTELHGKTKKSVLVVDVRTPEEFAIEHIPGAINVAWKNDPKAFVEALPKDARKKKLRMYCNGRT